MEQTSLFYDDINDALRTAVKALGGTKAVAVKLWPEKTISDAQSYLNDCLNTSRSAHLFPEQVLLILRWAKEKNCHDAINYICMQAGYAPPLPLDPEDELAKLQREYIAAVNLLASIAPKIEEARSKLRIA